MRSRWSAAARIWLILMGLQFFALLTAGIFWVSETFIQLSLWRFSPHAKLLAVSAVAVWVVLPKGVRSRSARAVADNEAPSSERFLTPSPGATAGAGAMACPEGQAVSGIGTRTAHGLPFGTSRGTRKAAGRMSLEERRFLINEARRLRPQRMAITVLALLFVALMWIAPVVLFPANLALMLCLMVAMVGATPWKRAGFFLGMVCAISLLQVAAIGLARFPSLLPERSDHAVPASAFWSAHNTPPSALFLLPPDASAFSLHARRGQVVSFKLVPQLSGELAEWDRRLRDVLDVEDLSIYAAGVTGYRLSQAAMRQRYDELPSEHLFDVARRYGARYVFRSQEDPAVPAEAVAWRGAGGAVLYDVARLQTPAAGETPAARPRE